MNSCLLPPCINKQQAVFSSDGFTQVTYTRAAACCTDVCSHDRQAVINSGKFTHQGDLANSPPNFLENTCLFFNEVQLKLQSPREVGLKCMNDWLGFLKAKAQNKPPALIHFFVWRMQNCHIMAHALSTTQIKLHTSDNCSIQCRGTIQAE